MNTIKQSNKTKPKNLQPKIAKSKPFNRSFESGQRAKTNALANKTGAFRWRKFQNGGKLLCVLSTESFSSPDAPEEALDHVV